jgi:dienelactone hydrolase
MVSNKGDEIDLASLTLFDAASSKLQRVESDPMKRVDFGSALFSELSDKLIATFYEDERRRIYWKDKKFEADYKWLESRLRGKEPRFGSRTKDERFWLVSVVGDTEPGETYLFDRKSRKLTLQYRIREQIPRDALAPMQAVRYPSSDGLEIPAFLTLPKGVPAKGLPALLVPHGGPWGRDFWGYNGLTQFLANRGYAVLSPNFRGSTGYGKKFLNAGDNQWGDKMQDDITWGVKYLIEKGIADPKRVGIMGGSYGGYATLAGVAFTPDVYAAAVSIVGPSNLITLLESVPPYWEMIRKMFHVRMGDPTTPEGRKQLERQSPLNSANKIKTPLLVIQGANDPRVNKNESDQIVVALRDRGFPVEYLVAPDEGHGFARPVNNLAMFTASEKFLAKHLGGRFQEGATAEVASRLKEITVDPKTVVLAKKIDAGAVGLPKPTLALVASTDKYKASLRAGERSVDMSLAVTLKEENGAWVATDSLSGPMGEIIDTTVLAKDTLIVTRRSVKQGPVLLEIEFKDNRASGKINMGGQEKPIDADVGGPLFADAAGAGHSIAALPLAEGYSTTFRNFDVQKQKVKLMQLKVAGTEQVTVPAGAFDAFRVEITSAEGGADKITMWIAKQPRRVVKVAAVLPQMGGATLTAELMQ